MKKKNLRLLNLNKKTISILKLKRIKGGTNNGTKTLGSGTEGFAETYQCSE